jgi:hypothetical protein
VTTPVIDEGDDAKDLLGDGEGRGAGLGDCDGDGDGEGLGTELGECEGDGEGLGAGLGERKGEGEGLGDALADGEGDGGEVSAWAGIAITNAVNRASKPAPERASKVRRFARRRSLAPTPVVVPPARLRG